MCHVSGIDPSRDEETEGAKKKKVLRSRVFCPSQTQGSKGREGICLQSGRIGTLVSWPYSVLSSFSVSYLGKVAEP